MSGICIIFFTGIYKHIFITSLLYEYTCSTLDRGNNRTIRTQEGEGHNAAIISHYTSSEQRVRGVQNRVMISVKIKCKSSEV